MFTDIVGYSLLFNNIEDEAYHLLQEHNKLIEPFIQNNSGLINYALPEDSRVSLSIYDLQGRVGAELVNDMKTAGYHSLTWNASSHPSGIYFVKMQADKHVSTQKLMLVK